MSGTMFAAKMPVSVRRFTRPRKYKTVTTAYYSYDTKNSKLLEKVHDLQMFHILAFIGDGDLGIYSVKSMNGGTDCIIAFRTFEDAFRYKTLLEAEMSLVPYVQFASRFELEHMCAVGNYKCRVVDEGVLVTPPTNTIKITDWERRSALLKGNWTVRDKDT